MLGVSYYDAKDWRVSDLDQLSNLGYNLIRVWMDWGIWYDRTDSFFDANGNLVDIQNFLDLVRAAAARNIIVDVTVLNSCSRFDGDPSGDCLDTSLTSADLIDAQSAIQNAVFALRNEPNVLFDIVNEHDNSDAYSSHTSTMTPLVQAARNGNPNAIISYSSGGGWDASQPGHLHDDFADVVIASNIDEELNSGVDLLIPHPTRTTDWYEKTYIRVNNIKQYLQSIGRNVPVYLQENHRRNFLGPGNNPYTTQAEFTQAALEARDAGAAGWVFHTDAGFDLGNASFFASLDPVEQATVDCLPVKIFGPGTCETIIDNGSTGTSFTGTWQTSSGSNPYDTESLYSNLPGDTYTFNTTINGTQEISLWWTYWDNRCTNVAVDIYDNNTLLGTEIVDQLQNGGQWYSLGTYTFSDTAKVVINSQGGCTTSADACKIAPDGGTPPCPTLPTDGIMDDGSQWTSSTGTWQPSSGADPYGGGSLYSDTSGSYEYCASGVNGSKDVSLWWTEWSNRCTVVQVDIYDGNTNIATVNVDQQANGGQWNSLGTFTFSGTARVVINSQGGCTTSADACKITP
ncbi:MAG: hypothetical protein GY774_20320 [Planctomycetes bacterium]|nr:hypothetical protein [Planctomycetota bacterium]